MSLGLKNTSRRLNKKAASQNTEKILAALHDDKLKKLTIRIPGDLHRKLKAKTALDGISINEYLQSLIKDSLLSESRIDM